MSKSFLFKQNPAEHQELKNASQKAATVLDIFQKLTKHVNPNQGNPCLSLEDNQESSNTAERYAKMIIACSNPTAVESAITAAISNLNRPSLIALKINLLNYYKQAKKSFEQYESGHNRARIHYVKDAYFKSPSP